MDMDIFDSKYYVLKHLDWVMSSHGMMSPKHHPSKDHSPAVLFRDFVEYLVYDAIIESFSNDGPTFSEVSEANYYGIKLFPKIASIKENDQIDLRILYFKRALCGLIKGGEGYVDVEVLAAEPFNIKYAVAIKLIKLGLITNKQTINKIKSGDVSLNIITRVLHQESIVDEVYLRECLTMLKQLAKFTK